MYGFSRVWNFLIQSMLLLAFLRFPRLVLVPLDHFVRRLAPFKIMIKQKQWSFLFNICCCFSIDDRQTSWLIEQLQGIEERQSTWPRHTLSRRYTLIQRLALTPGWASWDALHEHWSDRLVWIVPATGHSSSWIMPVDKVVSQPRYTKSWIDRLRWEWSSFAATSIWT